LYNAFRIGGGSYCWMLSNLDYGIPTSDQLPQNDNCIAQKYCLASDPICSAYGGLYQWDELMQFQIPASGSVQGLCPPEWHVPTQAEWQDLINAVVATTPGDAFAGSYLKDPNAPFGFHALLEGILYQNLTWAFTSANPLTASMFWTSSTDGTTRAIARGLNIYTYSVSLYSSSRANAFPVRCVKD